MDNNILVSIIVPVYNVEKYVRECVESILSQTYHNIEIIIVNDGSTDSSVQICSEFNDSRIHIVTKSNGGLSDARNKGVEVSNGEYILFVDSDDVVHPQIVENLLGLLLKYNGDISGCAFLKFKDGNSFQWNLKDNRIYQWTTEDVIQELVCSHANELTIACCKLYRKDILLSTPFPVGRVHEDEFVAYKILALCNKFIYSEKKMYGYRQRPNSIMSTYSVKAEMDRIDAKKDIFNYYKNNVSNIRSQARAYFLLMRNIELSYFKIYKINHQETFLRDLVLLFKDLYNANNKKIHNLSFYENFMIEVFNKSTLIYRIIEQIGQKIKYYD